MSVSAYGSSAAAPHIMIVMMENESESELIGNADAPNTNALATQYGLATESYAVGHPSLPNYLELLAGSTHGVSDDGTPSSEGIPANAQTLVNQLESAGISWRAYMESMPSAGYTGGDSTCCGGQYYQHHNPFVYFPSVTALSDFSSNMVPSTSIMTDLNSSAAPDFVWMTPNGTDDMHDGPTNSAGDVNPSVGDAWLGNFVSQVQSTTWYAQGGNIIIEWDEGMDSDSSGIGSAGQGGGGRIVTVDVSAALKAHPQQDSTPVNTAGILRSVESSYGLAFLGDASDSANGNIDSLLDATSPPTTTTTAALTTTTTAAPTTTTTAAPTTTTAAPTTTTAAPTTTTTAAPTTTTTAAPTTTTTTKAPTTTTSLAPTTTTSLAPTTTTTAAPTPTTTVPLTTSSGTTTTQTPAPTSEPAPTTTTTPAPTSSTTVAPTQAPTTTTTKVPATTPGPESATAGGSSDPSAVSAPSGDLAFTGPGPGIGAMGIVGGGLVLLGLALLALVGMPRRLVARLVPLGTNTRPVRSAGRLCPGESRRDDLWLHPPR